jgi:hypothetical protein
MESEGRVLDEAKLDMAIADLLKEEESEDPEPALDAAKPQTVFPVLPEQAEMDEVDHPRDTGFAATLRQKWAELSGAA